MCRLERVSTGLLLGALTCGLLLGGCDCEDRIRRAISDPGPRVPDQAQDSVTSGGGGGIGDPQEDEPNNDRASATRYTIGRDHRPMLGDIGEGGDREDWFLLGATSDEIVEISVTPKSPTLDVTLSLLTDDDHELVYDLAGPGKAEVVPYAMVEPGQPLVVRVRQKSGEGSYVLTHKKHMSASAIEAEPNDTPANALRANNSDTIQGFYDRPRDRDYITLAASQIGYGVALGGVEGLSQTMRVYLGEDLFWEGNLPPGRGVLAMPNLAPEREWTIELSAEGEAFSREDPYVFRVMQRARPIGRERDEFEPNDPDDISHLEPFEDRLLDPLLIRGYLHDASDRDELHIEPGRGGGVLHVKLTDHRAAPSTSLLLGIGDGAAERMVKMPTGERVLEVCEVLGPRAIELGEVSILVSQRLEPTLVGRADDRSIEERLSGGHDYTLEVWRDEEMIKENDMGVIKEAIIAAGLPQTGHLMREGEERTYRLDITGDKERRVVLATTAHELDLAMELRDDEQGLIAKYQASAAGGEERGEVELPPGTYFVTVSAVEGASCQPYELSFDVL